VLERIVYMTSSREKGFKSSKLRKKLGEVLCTVQHDSDNMYCVSVVLNKTYVILLILVPL